MSINIYELKPNSLITSQKSFYKKAYVLEEENSVTLYSYGTRILTIYFNRVPVLKKHWNGWSRTTANHINSFVYTYRYHGINKKEWEEL